MDSAVDTGGPSMPKDGRANRTSQWLIDMTSESENNLKKLGRLPSRIRRVPAVLRNDEKHAKMFDPAVVTIGPYHRDKPDLSAMEDHKKVAAAAFAGPDMDAFYKKVLEIVGACRDCYDDGPYPPMSDDEFALMLFFDACFILHFIDWFVKKERKDFIAAVHLHGFILRDMFLLENQLPYLLLEKLTEMKSVPIDKFLIAVAATQGQRQKTEEENCNISIEGPYPHLLARLREWQLGPAGETPQLAWSCSSRSFRSAKELIDSGINLQPGETSFLRDVKFEPGLVRGKLSLPHFVVDSLTRSRLLNMIALEMCGTADGDYGITSFVCFLDLLIDHADDVKELRRSGVLLNALGSDEQVAELFNDIATDLMPDQLVYSGVMISVNMHYKFKARVSVYNMLHTHFGSPWSTIAFLAGVVLLLLTVAQTVFAVIQTFQPPTK